MSMPKPWDFHSELSEGALRPIAEALLDVRYNTLAEMTSEFDDNYTREATIFGRQRNMLIDMAQTRQGMSLVHAGMDVTFKIGNIPVRFFTDDPDSPQKHGFFRRNQVDNLFPVDGTDPQIFRFIVEKAIGDEDQDRVYFAGFNAFNERVCEWEHRSGRGSLHSVNGDVPPVVPIAPARVSLKAKPGRDSSAGNESN